VAMGSPPDTVQNVPEAETSSAAVVAHVPAPPSRLPPQKAGRAAFNPLRALGPVMNLLGGAKAQSPREPQPASASAPNLPCVAKAPPTPPPARNNSRQRPTPRKTSTPREASPQLPAVGPSASPRRPGSNTPRDTPTPTPEVCDSPVPRGKKEIRPPANIVARSAPAAPGAPPGARVGGAGGPADAGLNGQCREMFQVQGNALKLLNEVFDFPVTEDASVSILDQYPELAWLAHCMQRCPLPPCWTSVDGEGESRYIDMETGDNTEVQPLLKNFSEMARLMLEWRQAPSAALHVSKELQSRFDYATEEAARSRRVWTGPHVDQSTGMKFWHCEATGRSTWGDPGAASEFLARVAERLRRALPQNLEGESSPTTSVPAPATPAQAAGSGEPAPSSADSPKPTAPKGRPSSRSGASKTPRTVQESATAESQAPKGRPSSRSGVPSNETADSQAAPSNGLGDTGEMVLRIERAAQVREMMAKISNSKQTDSSSEELVAKIQEEDKEMMAKIEKGELVPKRPDMAALPSPARAGRSPRLPSSARGPSPRTSPSIRAPSPRSLASARGVKFAHTKEPILTEWGVPGNRIYQEAAAEVAAPTFKPGACRPGGSARRRIESSEKLQPISSTPPRKQVTFLERDGVTTVRPGDEALSEEVLLFDGSGEAGDSSEPRKELSKELNKVPMPPRVGTPARPTSRHGEDEVLAPGTPRPRTPAMQAPRGALRPCTPCNEEGEVVVTPRKPTQVRISDIPSACDKSSDSSSSSSDDEDIDVSPGLGNTAAAKELCDMAVAAACDMACDSQSPKAVEAVAESTGALDAQAAFSQAFGADMFGSAKAVSKSATAPLDPLEAAPPASSPTLGDTLSNTLGGTANLGNTAAAWQLCDDAISAAVGSAVNSVAFNGTYGSVHDVETGDMICTIGGVDGGTLRTNMGGTMGMTLGATGDVPPIAPGEGLSDHDMIPTSPEARGTTALLRDALGACSDDDEDQEQLSMSLMSICSPTRRDYLNSSLGDSPSIILVEDNHWTPCKALPRAKDAEDVPQCSPSPCSPPAPRSKRKDRKVRPVRCLSPQPLSARGHERHDKEMAELGLPVDAPRSARRPRPQGGVRHIAVAGGA